MAGSQLCVLPCPPYLPLLLSASLLLLRRDEEKWWDSCVRVWSWIRRVTYVEYLLTSQRVARHLSHCLLRELSRDLDFGCVAAYEFRPANGASNGRLLPFARAGGEGRGRAGGDEHVTRFAHAVLRIASEKIERFHLRHALVDVPLCHAETFVDLTHSRMQEALRRRDAFVAQLLQPLPIEWRQSPVLALVVDRGGEATHAVVSCVQLYRYSSATSESPTTAHGTEQT